MTIASLAMYPFPHLRPAYDQLWDGVRSRLSFVAPSLDWDVEADDACRRDDLVLGQICGWPLMKYLAESVRVVGTFDYDVPGAADGTYCSVLISNVDDSIDDIVRRADLRVVANSADSLSGWISLQSAVAAFGVTLSEAEWTGSHAASIEALRAGRGHLAAIDAVSWLHLGGPGLSEVGLKVVGDGPRIPCLPLVTSRSSSDDMLAELRQALRSAVEDPALGDVCSTLRIRAFVDRELADYQGLSGLLQLG